MCRAGRGRRPTAPRCNLPAITSVDAGGCQGHPHQQVDDGGTKAGDALRAHVQHLQLESGWWRWPSARTPCPAISFWRRCWRAGGRRRTLTSPPRPLLEQSERYTDTAGPDMPLALALAAAPATGCPRGAQPRHLSETRSPGRQCHSREVMVATTCLGEREDWGPGKSGMQKHTCAPRRSFFVSGSARPHAACGLPPH